MYTVSWKHGDSAPQADGGKTWEEREEIASPLYSQETQLSEASVPLLSV